MKPPLSPDGWFKSSYSNASQTCVEVRFDEPVVRVRDSKNPSGAVLGFGSVAWDALVAWQAS